MCCSLVFVAKKKRNKQTKITKFRVSSQTIIWQEKHDTVFWNWYLLWVKQFQLRRQNRMLVPARGSFQNFWKHSVLFIWGPPRLALEFRDISSLNNCFIIILTHQKQNFTQEIQQLGKISLMVLDGCRSRVGLMTLMHGDEERYLQPRRSESQEEVRAGSQLLEVHWKAVFTADKSLKADLKPSNGCLCHSYFRDPVEGNRWWHTRWPWFVACVP